MSGTLASARVRITVELSAGTWGADCHLSQVFDQAKKNAVESLRVKMQSVHCTIIGEPEVVAVLVPEKDR